MIRFVNIENGRTYNGDQPYVHWFDDQQSTDIIYVQKICVVSDAPSLSVFMEPNDVFHIIDPDKITKDNLVYIDGSSYQDISNLYTDLINGNPGVEEIKSRNTRDYDINVEYLGSIGYSSHDAVKYHVCSSVIRTRYMNAGEQFKMDYATIRNIPDVSKIWLSTQPNTYSDKYLLGNVYTYAGDGQDFTCDFPEYTSRVYLNIEGPILGSNPSGSEAAFSSGIPTSYHVLTQQEYTYFLPVTNGSAYGDDLFVYMIYIAGSSSTAAEYRESFFIQEHVYTEGPDEYHPIILQDGDLHEFTVGADFHVEHEEHKINLGNFGIEIPESIQKAIYPANPHEESKDNILLNRKYKELLMDYIDILGNKGSYQSLLNSLNWFEYGDLLSLKEIWKHTEWDKTIYNDQELTQLLSDHAKRTLTNYAKTTYFGIYCACQSIKESHVDEIYPPSSYKNTLFNTSLSKQLEDDNLDPQGLINRTLQIGMGEASIIVNGDQSADPLVGANFKKLTSMYKDMDRFLGEEIPELKNNALKWSRADMAIKMALLGNFFESYFTPVHLDLIHSTLEDIVFTNTMKAINGGEMRRDDYILHNSIVKCSVKDDEVFQLRDIKVQANSDTPFVNPFDVDYTTINNHKIFGIDEINTTDDFKDIPARFLPSNPSLVITSLSNDAAHIKDADWVAATEKTDHLIACRQELVDYIKHAYHLGQYFVEKGLDTEHIIQLKLMNMVGLYHYKDSLSINDNLDDLERISLSINTNITIKAWLDTVDKSDYQSFITSPLYGLDYDESTNATLDPEIATIILNTYTGVGVCVPMVFTIPVNEGDNITQVYIARGIGDDEIKWDYKTYEHLYTPIEVDGKYYITVVLKMLCTKDCKYDIRASFTCTSGQTYTKRVHFNVVDTRRASLNVYKIVANNVITIGGSRETRKSNDYMFTHMNAADLDEYQQYYTQYIPISQGDANTMSEGAKLQWIVILRSNWNGYNSYRYRLDNNIGADIFSREQIVETSGDLAKLIREHPYNWAYISDELMKYKEQKTHNWDIVLKDYSRDRLYSVLSDPNTITTQVYSWLYSNFDRYHRADVNTSKEYDIFVSKGFSMQNVEDNINWLTTYIENTVNGFELTQPLCLRMEQVYIPQSHSLIQLQGPDLLDICVSPKTTLAVVPSVKYLQYIDSYEWEFKNSSTGEIIQLPSIKEPFIGKVAPDIESNIDPYLKPGYYDIKFRYKLSSTTDNINEINLTSAFVILPDIQDSAYEGSDLWDLAKQKIAQS
jgi:hypothetical protein